jgi:beta-mannosidase
LDVNWEVASTPPGAVANPADLKSVNLAWDAARVPGTAATALRAAGRWQQTDTRDFDAEDWWFRTRFTVNTPEPNTRDVLHFDGLATIADVWLNGARILHSKNMYLAHEIDVTSELRSVNELFVRFHSLNALLQQRRRRPRWRTRLVDRQQLRWFRTTLLGRIPGWSPPIAPVGPWRPIWLEQQRDLTIGSVQLRSRPEASAGVVEVDLRVATRLRVTRAVLQVGQETFELSVVSSTDGWDIRGEARLTGVQRWWPHTHGPQALFGTRVAIETAERSIVIDLGRIGFRTIQLLSDEGDFALTINGIPVFCRGACWTSLDIAALVANNSSYRAALECAKRAGMNMLRVGGTMFYEVDDFYDLCDELGILVWQDFMFANMDYPWDDEDFSAEVETEAGQVLRRLRNHPCVAMLCGNSEVEQQCSMLGLAPELGRNPLFAETLPSMAASICPDIPYWPSSPSGGPLPFRADAGASHYYGVGAYLRPLYDARMANVRFASECLAFANVPEDASIWALFANESGNAVVHHPRWKRGVPRDSGASWDFEDVRDHYLAQLFGVDPNGLRSTEVDRYLTLSRLTTGEAMASVFGEWRRVGSTCHGGLVWFFQDLWPGAGWGVVDSSGRPKSAYYYLKRQLQPVALILIDEGLNGLALHLVNETADDVIGQVRLRLYRDGKVLVASGTCDVVVPARGGIRLDTDTLVGNFVDPTYAYRFGPPGHDVVVAALVDTARAEVLAEDFYFPLGLPSAREGDIGLAVQSHHLDGGRHLLEISTQRFAYGISIDAAHFTPDDNYFHLEPESQRTVVLDPSGSGTGLRGTVRAANARVGATIGVSGTGA